MTTNNFINLETFRGDNVILNFTIKQAVSNLPIDITDWLLFLTIKRKITLTEADPIDSDADLQKDITNHVDPIHGVTRIVLTHDETDPLFGTYQYDIQYKDAGDMVNTVMRGTFTFFDDVTRRNTV